jgi:Xaa-Pro aminopeptidase
MLADRIPEVQAALAEADLDAWLLTVFQGNDPISLELLGLSHHSLISRRCYYLIPREGEPRKLAHGLEPAMLDQLPGEKTLYVRWQEHAERLGALVDGVGRLAVHYSPNNVLPTISRLDAGTAEFLRSQEMELVSAADLAQRFAATWSQAQLDSHRRASEHLHRIVLEAFDLVGDSLRAGDAINEYTVQRFILDRFEDVGLYTFSEPIVGVNEHAADPHYQPGPEHSAPISKGDFLLVDLWAKERDDDSIYGDITWCGVCSLAPTERQQEIFGVAVAARDAGVELLQSRYPHTPVYGYEVDDAVRAVIDAAGYGDYFIHRTGHSIGIEDHGQGANIDNFETHDTRQLLPMTGFSIEPGIYIPGDFGVRTEINIALTEDAVEITGAEPQKELIRVLA